MIKQRLKRIPGARRIAKLLGLRPGQSNCREFLLKMFPENAVCAEIGVHQGDFSAQILRTVRPKALHLVDPWKYEESDIYEKAWYGGAAEGGQTEMDERYEAVRLRFEPDIRAGRVRIHRGYSGNVLDKFPDEYFDWVYIDGNHLYEFVKQDLELSLKKTKTGGYIAGDDYHEGGWWQGGVKKAVDEFLRERIVHLVTIRNGQFVLKKTRDSAPSQS